jgi:hypothetical protein
MSQLKRKFNHIVSKEHNCEEEEWDEYCYNKENSHPNRRIITESLNEPCVEIIKKKRGSDAENVPTNQYEEIFVEDKAVDDLASFSSKTSKLREGNISKFNESIRKCMKHIYVQIQIKQITIFQTKSKMLKVPQNFPHLHNNYLNPQVNQSLHKIIRLILMKKNKKTVV